MTNAAVEQAIITWIHATVGAEPVEVTVEHLRGATDELEWALPPRDGESHSAHRARLAGELADCYIALVAAADTLNIDIEAAALSRLALLKQQPWSAAEHAQLPAATPASRPLLPSTVTLLRAYHMAASGLLIDYGKRVTPCESCRHPTCQLVRVNAVVGRTLRQRAAAGVGRGVSEGSG